MRVWLAKFRISCALDSHVALAEHWRRRAARSDKLHRFAVDAEALGRALKATVPPPDDPPFLHRSIMDAVEAAERCPRRSTACEGAARTGRVLRMRPLGKCLGPAVAFAVLVLFAAGVRWHASHESRQFESRRALASASAALNAGEQLAQVLPQAMVAPLSEEWQRLNQDLNRSAEFFLASVP